MNRKINVAKYWSTKKPVRWLAVASWLCVGSVLAAEPEIYVYQAADGSYMITNHPRHKAGYELTKLYSKSEGWREPLAEQPEAPEPGPDSDPLPDSEPLDEYDELIAEAARTVSLDPLLIKSVIHAESAFDPRAVSIKGASGLMQLMPSTARQYGVSRIFNPRENVMAGSRYLSDLFERFDGNLELTLASYNAGEYAVLNRAGIPPFPETRRYVEKVMRLYRHYQAGE